MRSLRQKPTNGQRLKVPTASPTVLHFTLDEDLLSSRLPQPHRAELDRLFHQQPT